MKTKDLSEGREDGEPFTVTLSQDRIEQPFTVTLSQDQIGQIVEAVARWRGALPQGFEISGPRDQDGRISQSLMRGLAMLAHFPADGGPRGVIEMAAEMGISPSTTHRYMTTLVEMGLLERPPGTRKYRLVL